MNIDNWKLHLAEYWDQHILDILEYGFPLDFNREFQLIPTEVNHESALQNVKNYLQLDYKAILEAFTQPPFPIHISLLMVRDKQDSEQKKDNYGP